MFEQAQAPREFGAGLQLGPNAMAVLAKLGLTGQLAEIAIHPPRIVIGSATSGRQIASMQLGAAFEQRFNGPYCTFARPGLHRALARAAIASGARLTHGAKTQGFTEADGGISLAFENRAPWRGDAVVGADGLWSALRAQLNGAAAHRYTGHTAWRATVPLARVPGTISHTDIGLFLCPSAHIVHYPIHGDMLNLVVVVEGKSTATGWQQPGDHGELLARVANLARPVRQLVEMARDLCRWPLFATSPARTTGAGRLTLVGDAAHPMLPYLAAGAAMGIEDAWVLARSLRATSDFAKGMRRYEQTRAARVERVQAEARKNGVKFHLSGAPALARDLALGMAERHAPGLLTARLAWLYGGGPV